MPLGTAGRGYLVRMAVGSILEWAGTLDYGTMRKSAKTHHPSLSTAWLWARRGQMS